MTRKFSRIKNYTLSKVEYEYYGDSQESVYTTIDTLHHKGNIMRGIEKLLSNNNLLDNHNLEIIHENNIYIQAWTTINGIDYCIEIEG